MTTKLQTVNINKGADWRNWKPKRGEVYLCDFGQDSKGSEYKGLRPAVILSNNIGNYHSTILQVAPITSANKQKMPVHVRLNKTDGMKIDNSIISIEQTACISKERMCINGNIIKITQLNKKRMDEINRAIMIQFGLV